MQGKSFPYLQSDCHTIFLNSISFLFVKARTASTKPSRPSCARSRSGSSGGAVIIVLKIWGCSVGLRMNLSCRTSMMRLRTLIEGMIIRTHRLLVSPRYAKASKLDQSTCLKLLVATTYFGVDVMSLNICDHSTE